MVKRDSSRNLVPKKERPFRVLRVKEHTVTVDCNGIHIVVYIGRITLGKTSKEARRATKVERYDDVPLKAGNIGDEYDVECIVRHKDGLEGTTRLIRWHSYRPTDNTWKPAHQLAQHFIQQHWERQ